MTTKTVDFQTKELGEICRQGEHNTIQLVFILSSEYENADYINIEFEKSNNEICTIERLVPNENTVTVNLTSNLTDIAGQLKIQLVAYQGEEEVTNIMRSSIISASIRPSIGHFFNKGNISKMSSVSAFLEECKNKITTLWNLRHIAIINGNYDISTLTAGTVLLFNEPITNDIVIDTLDSNNYDYPEYILDFKTGEITYSLVLPEGLEWVKELTILPNCHYQISIRNNIILWCAVKLFE